MLNWQGHIKLVDFGLSQMSADITQVYESFVGTSGYNPPEMLMGKGHNYLLDAYSLGVLIYNMLHGSVPIKDLRMKRYDEAAIVELHEAVVFRDDLSLEARDLVQRLMSVDPNNRLLGDTEIKSLLKHPWLKKYQHFAYSGFSPDPVLTPDLSKNNFDSCTISALQSLIMTLDSRPSSSSGRHGDKTETRKYLFWYRLRL